MLIATLLAVWAAQSMVNRIDDAAAQSSAVWMLSIRKAAQDYLLRHGHAMRDAVSADALLHAGYRDWTVPEIDELKYDGLLSAGFPERGARGLRIAIRVLPGAGCPGPDCILEALVYSKQAVLRGKTDRVDEQMMAQWLLAAQGWGGAVTVSHPGQVAGRAFAFSNPPAPDMDPLPAGTIAMAITSEQLSGLDFLRVGDSRNPDFQGAASVKGDIDSAGSLSVQGHVQIGAQAEVLTVCSPTGAVAREYYGGLLVCRSGKWRPAARGGGGGYMRNTVHGCYTSNGASTANPVTGACSCPVDHDIVMISDSGPEATTPEAAAEGRMRGYLCVQ